MAERDEVEGWVRTYFEATRSMDAARWAGCFAEGATLEDPVGSPMLTTPEAVRERGVSFLAAFEEVGLHEEFIHVNGLEAVARFTGRGVAGGQETSFEGIDLFRFDEDGKIVLLRGFFDPPGT